MVALARGVGVSYERGTPVPSSRLRDQGEEAGAFQGKVVHVDLLFANRRPKA